MKRVALRIALCLLLFSTAVSLSAATFTSSQSGNWSSASTWGGAGVPGSGDSATILHIVTLDVPVTVATVTLSGTLNGSQSITITTAFNWNGGTLTGSGGTSIPSGSVATLGNYSTLDGRPLTIGGTFNETSPYYFYMLNNAVLTNNGTIDIQGDGGIFLNSSLGTTAINNNGTIKKSGGTGTATINIPINATSGSQFLQQSGTINVAKVIATNATFNVSSGATISFNTNDTRTFDTGSAITGLGTIQWASGTNSVIGTYSVGGTTANSGATTSITSPTTVGAININSGTLTLDGASTLSVPTLTISGGTLNGSAPITFSSTPMTWTGGTIGGSGLMTIPAGTTVNLSSVILDGRPLTNAGTINLTSSYFYVGNNAVITNTGTIDFTNDGNIYMNGTVGSTVLNNSGTITKSGGTSGSTLNVPLTMSNGSQLNDQASILYMGPITASGATFNIFSGATLYFYYSDTRTFDATSSIGGSGTLQFGSGTNTISGNVNVSGATLVNGGTTTMSNVSGLGALTVSGGTLTLNGASTITVPTLTMAGGILGGTAPIGVTSTSMSWTNGTISGSGLLSIPASTTLTLTSLVLDGRPLTNAGTINMVSNGTWYVGNNAVVTNNGLVDMQGDSSININGATGSTSFINNGIVKKSNGTSGSTFTVPLTMTSGSQLLVQSSILYVAAVTSASASFSVSTSATLWFYYGDTRTFDSSSSISGTGTVNWGGGTNTVNGSYGISGTTISSGGTATLNNITSVGNVTMSNGTLTLNSASALTIPTLSMSFGTLNGTAPINVTSASMTWSNGTLGGSGLLTIPGGTTITLTSLTLDGRPLTNGGTINMVSNGSWYIGNNATVTNDGTLDLQGDSQVYMNGTVGTTSFINNGTVKKSAGATGSNFNVPLVAHTVSFFLAQSGPTYFGPITSTGATFDASAGATLYFYYSDTRTFDAASNITGTGTALWSSGTNTVNANYAITGTTSSAGGTATITNITSTGALNVTGGTLTLNSASTLSVPTLTISNGILNGTAPISVTGAAMTWSGGTIGGSGLLTIPNGTTITASFLTVDGRPIANNGTFNMVSNGYVYLTNNAVFTNNNIIDLQGDSSFNISGPTGTISLTNNGTLKKTATVGNGSPIVVPLIMQSGSQLLIQSGTIYTGAVTSTNATFSISSGCTLISYYGGASSFDSSSTISGLGTAQWQGGTTTFSGTISTSVNLTGGTLTLNSAATQSVPTLLMTGGTLAGTGNLSITGAAMTWTGGVVSGSGTLTISNSTTITVNGGFYIDGRPVTNNGTINFSGSSYAYVMNNAVITNNGTIDFLADGALYLNSVAGTTSIVNNSTIRKSGGTTSYVTVPLTAASGSQLLAQSGTFYLGNVAATSATFSISSGATLYTYTNDARTFDTGTTISGLGTFQQASGSSTVSGTISSNVNATGGTLTINSAAAQSVPTLIMAGGTLNGTANVNITGASMAWTSGALSGSGTLSIPVGTTITLNGGIAIDGRPVTNAGTFNFASTSYAYVQNNAVITNSGLIDFLNDGAMYLNSVAGTTAVINSGTIRKSAGTTSYFSVPLTAQSGSQFLVQSGTVYIGNVAATGATFNISAGATIYTYTSDNRTFDAATSIVGAGTYQPVSGTSTVSGTISSNITISGGTLTVNSASPQSIPTLIMAGGTLNGTANINITGTSMSWTGGTLSGSGTLSIPAGTTITINGGLALDGRAMSNGGTINFTTTNYMYLQNNAVLTNTGVIDFLNDGAMYLNSIPGTTAVVNAGTIRKSGGTNGTYFTVPLTAQSGSQFLVQSGTVYLGNVAATGATFNISSGATIYTYTSDNRTFDSASSVTGAGTFQPQGGTSTINGTLSANVLCGGGTLTLNSASTQTIPTLAMAGCTFNGTAAVNVTGASMNWSGGTIGGSGALTISAASLVTQNGYVYFDTRPVTLNGTLRFTSAVGLYMQNNASLTNNGTIDFQNDAAIVLNIAPVSLTNNGTIVKSAGTGTSGLSVPVTNAAGGTIQAASGILSFNSLAQSGTLYFPIAGATSFGKINVNGNFALGGTLTATTIGGYTPPNGTTFQVLTFGSSSGAFPNKNLDYSGGTFVESYAPASLILSAGPQALAITNVSPNRGPNAGGTSVNITGSDFVAGTTVTFGGTAAASVTFNNSTSLTVVTPAHTTGTFDVVVTNPSTQTATLTNGYTFTGLLAHYSFDVNGSPGKDVANNNDAPFVSGVTQVGGKVGQAGSFNSATMTLPSTASFNLRSGGDFTLDAFVHSSQTTNGNWFAKSSYGLGTNNQTQALFSFDNGSGGSTASTSNVFDGNWHHVAAVHRGSSAEVWVDGKLESSSTVSGATETGAFVLGAVFDGLIDEAKLYNYALTTTEIRTDALAADVSITKSATPTVTVGQNITYSIGVTNNGPVSATNVIVADSLPAGTSFVSANPSQGTCGGAPNLTCGLGTLGSGGSATITIIVTATASGTTTNTATVSANESDPVTTNNSASASTTASTLVCNTPTVSASGPTMFCAGGNVTLTANATGATSYQWYLNGNPIGAANGTTYTAASTGNYSVTVTYPSTCSASSAATNVTVNPLPPTPSITASGPTTFCNGGSVTLTAPAGYTYAWSNSATTQSINVTTSGSYTVTVIDGNGCSATSAPTNVNVTTITAPTVTPSGPTSFCGGGSVTLTANAGYASYLWSTGAATQSIVVNASGNYSVTVTDANGCMATSAPVTVNVTPAPAVTITGPGFTCPSTPVTLDAGAGYNSYSWSTGATTQTITVAPAASTTYSVTVTNGANCPATASKFVSVGNSIAASISGPSAACPGVPITLDAGAGYASYLWSNGATTQSITVTQNTTTTYSVTVGSGGCNGSASKTVTMNTAPSAAITGPATVCPNTSFTLDAGPGFAAYAWSTGATTQAITLASLPATQTYSVTVTAANGCTATASQTVTLGSGASATITAPSSAQPNATGLTASVPPGPGGTTYDWTITHGAITAGQGTPSITFSIGTSAATLGVTATSGSCAATGTKTVQVTNTADLSITLYAAPDPVTAGTTLTYTLQVVNHGPSSATNVTVDDTLPAGVTLLGASGSGWTCNATQCTMPSLLPGSPGPITITVKAPLAAGTITNAASVSSSITDPKPSNNSGSVTTLVNAAPQCPSAPPSLISPANGATGVISPVSLQWSAVAGASTYDVFTSVDGGPVTDAGSTASTSLFVNLPSGSITWFVVAHVPNCGDLTSGTFQFAINPASNCGTHGAPALGAPAQNATVASPVTFSWQAVPEAIGYRLFVSVNGGADEDIGTTNGATMLTHDVASGSITWVVDALFNGCPSTRSARGAFNIPQVDPCAGHGTPSLIAPANNTTSASSGIDFSWTAVAGASGYRVWVAIDGAAPAVIGETGATSLHGTISNGAVDWFVEALFDGCASTSSAHFTFTVPKAQNCGTATATLVAPANNSSTPNAAVTFTWNSVAAATGYELYLSLDNGSPVLIGTTNSATTSLTKEVSAGVLTWFVRALFDGCPSRDSQPFTFTYAPAANCKSNVRPLLASPIDGSTAVTSPVNFEWSDTGATSYKLYVNGDLRGTSTTPHVNNIQLANGAAEWYVDAIFNGCATLRSTTSGFTVVSKPAGCVVPDRPTILAPGEVSAGVAYKVRWLPALGADAYVAQEANNAAFAGAQTFPATIDNKLTFSHPAAGTFFYRVRGISNCGAEPGAYSAVVGVSILPQNANDGAASPDAPVTLTYAIPLDAALAGQTFTATPTEPWLTVTPPSGTIPAGGLTLTVSANTAGLPLGTSLGGVTITTSAPASGKYASSGNTTSTTTLTVNVVQPVSPTSKSAPPPDALIIPAVAHADGFNSHFQSDVRLTNTGPQPMKYQITFTPSGEDGLANGKQATVDVDPGRTVALDDVLKSWFSSGSSDGSTGTLEIRPLTTTSAKVTSNAITGLANLVTFASSRTFNNTANGTFGQYIPAIPFANFIGKSAGTITLQQIAQSAKYRTNLGLVEGSGQPVSLLVSIFGSHGQKIKEFPIDLKGGQHTQLNSFLATQGLSLEDARVEVKVSSGSGKVTAYASVLDNNTSDPLLVTPTLLAGSGSTKYVLPGVADLNTWHSDVRIFNPSASNVDAQLMFVSQTGGVQTQSLTLGPNEVKELDNLLQSTFGVTNDGGALHISTASATNLIATARTYNLTTNGTYGQFISAVTPNDAAAAGTRPLQLLQVEESDRYRTNIGLAEVSGQPAKVRVTVVPPDSRVSANVELDLGPNEFRQLNQILKTVGMDDTYNARVSVQVIDGAGKITAYASVIDAQTGDPTLIQAQ